MAHLWIKWCLTARDVLFSSSTNPYVEHGRLVPDVVPFDHGKDINLLHIKFATPAYADARGHSICGQTWTTLNHLKNVLSCGNRSYHLPFRPHSNTGSTTSITQCLVNTSKNTSRQNPSVGKTPLVFFYSTMCIANAKSIQKMHVTIFHVGKHKRHSCNSLQAIKQLTIMQALLSLHSALKDISSVVWHISCAACSFWNRKKPPLFTGHYLYNRQLWIYVFWVISVYFNIRNTLPKSCSFLLGHPVYIHFEIFIYLAGFTMFPHLSAPSWQLYYLLPSVALCTYTYTHTHTHTI